MPTNPQPQIGILDEGFVCKMSAGQHPGVAGMVVGIADLSASDSAA
jgi:hypothetical protein